MITFATLNLKGGLLFSVPLPHFCVAYIFRENPPSKTGPSLTVQYFMKPVNRSARQAIADAKRLAAVFNGWTFVIVAGCETTPIDKGAAGLMSEAVHYGNPDGPSEGLAPMGENEAVISAARSAHGPLTEDGRYTPPVFKPNSPLEDLLATFAPAKAS